MTKDELNQYPIGLYTVYWKSGCSSLGALGRGGDAGETWIAPVNWLRPAIGEEVTKVAERIAQLVPVKDAAQATAIDRARTDVRSALILNGVPDMVLEKLSDHCLVIFASEVLDEDEEQALVIFTKELGWDKKKQEDE